MLIDVVRTETWEELNDEVKVALGVNSPVRTRSYLGLAQAVFEISQGTAQFMSHKRAIGLVTGQTAVFDGLLPYYFKEAYDVQKVSCRSLADVKEWVESLKKETNFVLFSEDHPVTGELYPFAEELDKLLNERRISSFCVSHARHRHESWEIRPYSARICSFSPFVSVALLGERFRSPSLVAQNMNWNKSQFLAALDLSCLGRPQNRSLVEGFEQGVASICKPFFLASTPRLYDRAACVFPDVSGEALAQSLFVRLGMSPVEGWKKCTTTNLCHWSTMRMFGSWWEPAPTPEILRGLLLFDLELLQTKDFAKQVISSYEEIRAQQSWDV